MMRKILKLETGSVALLALSIAALLAVQVVSFRNGERIDDLFQRQIKSRNLVLALERCLSLIKDAETGQRGYLLTGDEGYLQPYYAALKSLDETMRFLQGELEKDSKSARKFDEIQTYLGEKLQEARETIQLRRDSTFEAAVRLVMSDKGKITMDNLRLVFSELIADEQNKMSFCVSETQRSNNHSKTLTLIGGAFALATLVAAFALAFAKNQRLRDAQLSLQRANERLEAQNESLQKAKLVQDEVFDFAAHDVKNIIQTILLAAQTLKAKVPNNDVVSRYGSAIEREAKRITDLINELLLSAQTESLTPLKLEKSEVDVGTYVKLVCDLLSMQAERKKQTISVEVEGACKTLADKNSLKIIVENLVSNAIKYSPEGKPIRVNVWKDMKNVYVKVSDEGLGFSDEEKDKLFKRFQKLSARPTGNEISTGLGLSITKHLVELHGGRVWAESAGRNQGAMFVVELPLSQARETLQSVANDDDRNAQ